MDKDKLLALRKKKLESRQKQQEQALAAQQEFRDSIQSLAESISGNAFDWDKFKSHINELGKLVDVRKEVLTLSSELDKVHKDALKVKDIEVLINAINAKNNTTVINAIASLKKSIQKNAPDQKPEDFIPTRRVIKIGSVLQFDDKPTSSGGGGGGGGVQQAIIRDTANGKALAVVNPDGTNVSGGGGGGGDATAANQDEQTLVLEDIRDNTADFDTSGLATEEKQDNIIELLDDGSTFIKKTVTATSTGDNAIHTPASGKKIRLYFFGYSAGSNVEGILCSLKFNTSGTVFDRQYLTAAGQPYARNIQAGKRYIDGAIDKPLVLSLDASQTVYCNVELEEI